MQVEVMFVAIFGVPDRLHDTLTQITSGIEDINPPNISDE